MHCRPSNQILWRHGPWPLWRLVKQSILSDITESDSAYCERCYRISRYVRLSAWPSVILEHPAKAVGRNEVIFGRDIRVVPSNAVLDRDPDLSREGEIWGVGEWVSSCLTAHQHNIGHSKTALKIAAKTLHGAEWSLHRAWVIQQETKLLSTTSPYIDQFSKFFHCYTGQEICNKMIITDSTLMASLH